MFVGAKLLQGEIIRIYNTCLITYYIYLHIYICKCIELNTYTQIFIYTILMGSSKISWRGKKILKFPSKRLKSVFIISYNHIFEFHIDNTILKMVLEIM